MNIFVQEHKGKELTGGEMHDLVKDFCHDLGEMAHWPLDKFYNFVKEIPYINDDDLLGVPSDEIVSRPKYLLSNEFFSKLDCKKKAILIASWAKCNKIPYRFIAVAENPNKDIHHVFPQLWLNKFWVNADATLSKYNLGESKPSVNRAVELMK